MIIDRAKIPTVLVRMIVSDGAATTITWDDGRDMWAVRPAQPSGIIATRVSNRALQEQSEQISNRLLLTTLAAVAVAAIVAWFIADRLTARLREAANSVNRTITGEPVPVTGRDEVAVMTAALAATATALTDRLQRERAYTSDIAHDLRTPLTALVSATELLDDNAASRLVARQVARMRQLVEDLLELARADQQHGTIQPLHLTAVVRDTIEQLEPAVDYVMHVHDAGIITADPVRLRSALTNLIHNARRHGATPITIDITGRTVTITDEGPGFPDQLLRDGPRRFTALGASRGSGLGLAIATEHARNAGARLTLTNHPDHGAVATLTFAAIDQQPQPEARPG